MDTMGLPKLTWLRLTYSQKRELINKRYECMWDSDDRNYYYYLKALKRDTTNQYFNRWLIE